MNPADRSSCGHCVALTAILVALACPGCSSPGDVHHGAASVTDAHRHTASPPVEARRDAAPPAEVRSDNAVATTEKKSPRTRSASVAKAEAELQLGISSYEDAEYEIAVRKLRSALSHGLKATEDKGKAYKYLAFVDCTSGRMKSCHADFRNALQLDPTFDLTPAEAGHPLWGPVFRNARAEANGKAKTRPAYAAR
jgi:hypothetical protein